MTGVTTLYFQSSRPGMRGVDIYAGTLQPDGTFGPGQVVLEVSSLYNDQNPSISRDGLQMYFASDRPGSTPNPDSGIINSPFFDGKPSLSFDGTELYFHSAFRQGSQSEFFDIWKATRTKLKQPD